MAFDQISFDFYAILKGFWRRWLRNDYIKLFLKVGIITIPPTSLSLVVLMASFTRHIFIPMTYVHVNIASVSYCLQWCIPSTPKCIPRVSHSHQSLFDKPVCHYICYCRKTSVYVPVSCATVYFYTDLLHWYEWRIQRQTKFININNPEAWSYSLTHLSAPPSFWILLDCRHHWCHTPMNEQHVLTIRNLMGAGKVTFRQRWKENEFTASERVDWACSRHQYF